MKWRYKAGTNTHETKDGVCNKADPDAQRKGVQLRALF
jgi:hypothetical protein